MFFDGGRGIPEIPNPYDIIHNPRNIFEYDGDLEIFRVKEKNRKESYGTILSRLFEDEIDISGEFQVKTPVQLSKKENSILLMILFYQPDTIYGISKKIEKNGSTVNASTVNAPIKKLMQKGIVIGEEAGPCKTNKNPTYIYKFTEYGFYLALSIAIQLLNIDIRSEEQYHIDINFHAYESFDERVKSYLENDEKNRKNILELFQIANTNHNYISSKVIQHWNSIDKYSNDEKIKEYFLRYREGCDDYNGPDRMVIIDGDPYCDAKGSYWNISVFLFPLVCNIFKSVAKWPFFGEQPSNNQIASQFTTENDPCKISVTFFDMNYIGHLFSDMGVYGDYEYLRMVIEMSEEFSYVLAAHVWMENFRYLSMKDKIKWYENMGDRLEIRENFSYLTKQREMTEDEMERFMNPKQDESFP